MKSGLAAIFVGCCLFVQHFNAAAGSTNLGGIDFIEFPPGEFLMGCPTNVSLSFSADISRYQSSQAQVTGFLFAKHPVTVKQYCAFLDGSGFKTSYTEKRALFAYIAQKSKHFYPKAGLGEHPIGGITFDGATAFVNWFCAETGTRARLPSSAEWEYVAKGTTARIYPWGNHSASGFPFREAIGARPDLATPDGVFELIGPVYQWCLDDASMLGLNAASKITRGGTAYRDAQERLVFPPNWKWFAAKTNTAAKNQGFRLLIERDRGAVKPQH